MSTDEKPNLRKFRTTPFRMSFPHILTPRETKDDSGKVTLRYELNMLFPPGGFDRKVFMTAFKNAMVEKYGEDRSKWPKLKRKPDDVIRDFDEFNAEANKPLPGDWKGWTLVRANATAKRPPGVVGATRGSDGKFPVIRDEREVYGGRWAKATLEAFAYDHKQGGKGVTLGLCNVQLLKHDTKFGNAITAPEQDFDDADPEWAGEGDAFDNGGAAEDDDWGSSPPSGKGKPQYDDEIPF